jgi:regulatory protein
MAKHIKDIPDRLRHFCGFQDRSEKEVQLRLRALDVPPSQWDDLIRSLKEEGFLDDSRFAHSFARGKFRMNKWGKALIRQGLRQKGIDEELIQEAIEAEIDEEEYLDTLQQLAAKLGPADDYTEKAKHRQALLRKGYEHAHINTVMQEENWDQ